MKACAEGLLQADSPHPTMPSNSFEHIAKICSDQKRRKEQFNLENVWVRILIVLAGAVPPSLVLLPWPKRWNNIIGSVWIHPITKNQVISR
jgi:hypothetical protein